jgi:hypothetical protein
MHVAFLVKQVMCSQHCWVCLCTLAAGVQLGSGGGCAHDACLVLVCGGLQADRQLKPVLLQPPSSVQWSPVHPEPQDLATARAAQPLYFDPSMPAPLRVDVNAGEVLYLPAMWCVGFAMSLFAGPF